MIKFFLILLLATPVFADEYKKIDENTVEITRPREADIQTVTIKDLKDKISRLDMAIDNLNSELQVKQDEKAKLELDIQSAEDIGVSEVVISDAVVNP